MRQVIRLLVLGMLAAPALAAEPVFSLEQVRQDVQFIRETIAAIHPEPGSSIPPAQLDAALDAASQSLSEPMTRDAAWRRLATLNARFADAHLALLQPDRGAQMRAHLDGGGLLFPFEVHLSPAGTLHVRAALGGARSPLAGAAIDSVNGVPATKLVRELLELVHGDTPAHRAEILSRRWWFYYWKMYGAPASYTIAYQGKLATLPGSRERPEELIGSSPSDFERVYRFELLEQNAALLTVNTFDWPDRKRFYDFTAAAFARMRAAGTTTLIIDVRENGGGDDDMWKQGLLPYIATRPYQHTSTYIKKVIPGRASGSERVGEVVQARYDKWDQPDPANPLRFTGQVYVLVGGMTYSSAVLFSNVMQDFGFAKLAGTGGYARARQSGGVQLRTLPHTGLTLVVPRMVLDRPAGAQGAHLVRPDIELADDPYDRRALVKTLLRRIAQER